MKAADTIPRPLTAGSIGQDGETRSEAEWVVSFAGRKSLPRARLNRSVVRSACGVIQSGSKVQLSTRVCMALTADWRDGT